MKLGRVQVYRNLRKGGYSVRYRGKVIAVVDSLMLADCRFHVQPAGQHRCRKTGQRNVHAYVSGIVMETTFRQCAGYIKFDCNRTTAMFMPAYYPTRITYNPFQDNGFRRMSGEPVTVCRRAVFTPDGVFIE